MRAARQNVPSGLSFPVRFCVLHCFSSPPSHGGLLSALDRCSVSTKSKQNIPMLIPVQESREDAVQVGAGADEEEDDEQEGLELEDAEL